MTFEIGQTVMSKRTGMQYVIEARDEDTFDGEEVYIARSAEVADYVVPLLGGSIVEYTHWR